MNRRVFAPYLICKKCGYKQACSNCSLYLTFHKIKNKAICHHCSFEKEIDIKCNSKGRCEFVMYGPGVEKIFESERNFPNKITRIFSVTSQNKTKNKNFF